MPQSRHKLKLFVIIAAACLIAAVGYTFYAARKAATPAPDATSTTAASAPVAAPLAPPAAPPASAAATPIPAPVAPIKDASKPEPTAHAPSRPYVIALNVRDSTDRGQVEFAALDAIDQRTTTGLHCERVHFARMTGICLSRQVTIFSAQTFATVVDAGFQAQFTVRTDGIPSRARVSPDGRYAAFTVFVTGHSYADTQLSTATMLVDVAHRNTLANLEDFTLLKDGTSLKSPDSNYWGVTFARDSNLFYATLRTGGINYLVRGDISARTITVLHEGVECPALSPDQTRVAFKKMVSRGEWRLAVLNLTTFKETTIPEARSVDDQAEWLDNDHVLYALADPAPWMSVMVASADGSGQPRILAKGASSPAIVNDFRKP